MDRILAIDYGDKRIGIAISDPLGITAQGLETIIVLRKNAHFIKIKEIIERENVKKILVGLPLNMNGTKGERVKKTEKFIENLKKFIDLQIILWDERLTSIEAKRIIISLGEKTGKNKEKVDRIAAALLLENYLESISDQ